MADIIAFKRPTLKEKHKGKSLCKHGHHSWQLVQEKQFDVKQGKLVTLYQCKRCGAKKMKVL
ncbi:MAG: hypothetical protein CSA50_07535 [Gammaproteobacteria bacterium]|nr:MAG: hypothetical protein CSA50_07535 [Gammaproteobacteria bacterium]